MMSHPRPGQRVQIWYRAAMAAIMPYHRRIATVAIVAHGKPRNHGVILTHGQIVYGTLLVIVPAGNLRPAPAPGGDA
jgi:hypothetical protein